MPHPHPPLPTQPLKDITGDAHHHHRTLIIPHGNQQGKSGSYTDYFVTSLRGKCLNWPYTLHTWIAASTTSIMNTKDNTQNTCRIQTTWIIGTVWSQRLDHLQILLIQNNALLQQVSVSFAAINLGPISN